MSTLVLQSDKCNLKGLPPKQLVDHGEHENEWGGYFIINGHEKLIRMLVLTRKNYPVVVKRNTWKHKGKNFGDMGVLIRCVQSDQTSTVNIIHFLTTGRAKLSIEHNKAMFYIDPILILKALTNHTDKYIYEQLIHGFEDDQYYISNIQQMMRDVHEGEKQVHNQMQCKNYLGHYFRHNFYECPPWYTDEEICDFLLDRNVLIHLKNNEDKFNLMIFMIQKLYQCVQNKHKVTSSTKFVIKNTELINFNFFI